MLSRNSIIILVGMAAFYGLEALKEWVTDFDSHIEPYNTLTPIWNTNLKSVLIQSKGTSLVSKLDTFLRYKRPRKAAQKKETERTTAQKAREEYRKAKFDAEEKIRNQGMI